MKTKVSIYWRRALRYLVDMKILRKLGDDIEQQKAAQEHISEHANDQCFRQLSPKL